MAVLIAVVFLAQDFRRQFVRLATANSDNILWVLSRTEIELIALETLTEKALETDPPDLEALRLQFDILYSRVDTILVGPNYYDLRNEPKIAPRLIAISDFLERSIPLMESKDDLLRSNLTDFLSDVGEAVKVSRSMTLEGVRVFSADSENRRNELLNTIVRLGLLAVSLIVVLLGSIFALIRLNEGTRRASRAQRMSSDRLEAIVSTALDAVVVTNSAGYVIEYNPAAETIFGYSRTEAIGQNMAELLIPEKLKAAHLAGMQRFRQTGEAHVIGAGIVQLEAKKKDGTVIPVDLSLASVDTEEGVIFVGFLRDISDRLSSENALREARDRAIAGERSKSDLLAVMSHEMRTPLNGLLGTLELVDTSTLSPEHQRYCRIIRRSGEMLLGHVNDVLDISRLDVGKLKLQKRAFDLVELLNDTIETQTGRALERNTKIVLAPPHPALHECYSDPERLQQVLLNLLGNAVKFTRDGTITIETECLDELNSVMIRVIDTGIGIADDHLARIFGDFETIDSTYARENSGSGLGLGIAKRLVDLLGGEIGVESVVGEGSLFWITVPLAMPEGTKAANTAEDTGTLEGPVDSLSILMVEDNEINRTVARAMLEKDGHSVIEAKDGRSGVAKAQSIPVDIILMDISMPGMDGLEATRRIRSASGPNQSVPIIATTAHALNDEVDAFKAAGMTDVLIKPLTIRALRAVLGRQAGAECDVQQTVNGMDEPPPIIDEAVLASLTEQLSVESLNTLLEQCDKDFAAYMNDWTAPGRADQNRQDFAAATHKFAGSAAILGAAALREFMNELELAALDMSEQRILACVAEAHSLWIRSRALILEELELVEP